MGKIININLKIRNMKIIKYCSLALVLFIGLVSVSCEGDSDELTGNNVRGGLLELKNEAQTYVVGNGLTTNYDNLITIFQGNEKVNKIDIYVTFTTGKLGADGLILKDIDGNDSIVEVTSNKLLLKTITPAATDQREQYPFSVNYNELIPGLVVNGKPVTSADSELRIGDYFTLTYVSTLNTGNIHQNGKSTKIAVGTRFAGTYRVIETAYWRINVPRPDVVWVGQTRTIESVDAVTYKFIQFAGPFGGPTDNTHFFTISPGDVVETPTTYKGVIQYLNTFPVINCSETPALMINACPYTGNDGKKNIIVRDDVNGKDKIYRTYGYNTTTGAAGPREIYEVLEKIVD